MKGTYRGSYKYDRIRIQKQIRHDQTFFSLEITEDENGHFFGFVEDDIDIGGTPGKGTIKGEKIGNEIFFTKEMPKAAFLINGEMKTYDRQHPKIYYKGTLTGDYTEGVWKIKYGVFLHGLIFLLGIRTTGTWSMKKMTIAK